MDSFQAPADYEYYLQKMMPVYTHILESVPVSFSSMSVEQVSIVRWWRNDIWWTFDDHLVFDDDGWIDDLMDLEDVWLMAEGYPS